MREAMSAAERGELTSPPRTHAQLVGGRVTFTAGSLQDRWFGYRSYDSFDREPGEQVVVVHDRSSGEVRGIAIGNELGQRRVGAIGAVAVDALASPDASVLGLVGSGRQAWAQLWAISSVRPLDAVRVFSRDPDRRTDFARRAAVELGVGCVAIDSAHGAVDGADIVVLATNSPTPVIDESIAPGALVTTLGPKQVGRSEFTPALVAAADVVVTDSVAQVFAYDPPNVLADTPQANRLVSLGAVLTGEHPGRTSDHQRVVFCSVGLAGTEVFLLAKMIGLA